MSDPAVPTGSFEVYDLALGHRVGELLQLPAGGPDEPPDDIQTNTLRVRLNRQVRAVELPMPEPTSAAATTGHSGREYKHVLLLFHVAVDGPESWLGQRVRSVGLEVRFLNFPGRVDSMAPAPDYVMADGGVSVNLNGRCWASGDVALDPSALAPTVLNLPGAGASGRFELSGQFQRTLALTSYVTRVAALGLGGKYAKWELTRVGDDIPLAGRDHPFAVLVCVPEAMEAVVVAAQPSVTVTSWDRLHLYPISLVPDDVPSTPDGWWQTVVLFEPWPG